MIFVVLLLFGLVGTPDITPAAYLLTAVISVGFLVFLFALNIFPTFWPGAFSWLRDPAIQALLIVLLVMGLVAYFVIGTGPGEPTPKKLKRWVGTKVE